MQPKRLLTLAVILAFIAFMTWSTLSAQKFRCEVCVDFNGGHQCATASHSTEAEAERSAQTSACGPLARGMNDTIACENQPPASKKCHER